MVEGVCLQDAQEDAEPKYLLVTAFPNPSADQIKSCKAPSPSQDISSSFSLFAGRTRLLFSSFRVLRVLERDGSGVVTLLRFIRSNEQDNSPLHETVLSRGVEQ
jgi:hypothetical protein